MNCTINSASNFSGLQAGISQISPAQLAVSVRKSTLDRPFICLILLSRRRRLFLYVVIVLYSGLLEVGQSFILGRDMSGLDFLANTLGVIFGALFCDRLYTGFKK